MNTAPSRLLCALFREMSIVGVTALCYQITFINMHVFQASSVQCMSSLTEPSHNLVAQTLPLLLVSDGWRNWGAEGSEDCGPGMASGLRAHSQPQVSTSSLTRWHCALYWAELGQYGRHSSSLMLPLPSPWAGRSVWHQSLALQKGLCSEDDLLCVLVFSEAEGMVEYIEFGHLWPPCDPHTGQVRGQSSSPPEVPHVSSPSTHPQWKPIFWLGLL